MKSLWSTKNLRYYQKDLISTIEYKELRQKIVLSRLKTTNQTFRTILNAGS